MSKRLILASIAALVASVALSAQEASQTAPLTKSEKFYKTVPRHEFFFEGFAGFGPLMYKANAADQNMAATSVSSVLWPWKAGDLLTLKNPTGFGYGGGFGYIWHFHPNVGLLTGAEFAVYNGGINLSNEDGICFITSENVSTDNEEATLISSEWGAYSELQKLMVVQIPLMFQFMAPMGKGNHHFYAAIGAKLGINVVGKYWGGGTNYSHTWDGMNTYQFPGEPGIYPYHKVVTNPGMENDIFGEDEIVKESFEFRRLNAIGSAELGFRWKLGPGCGLYTGFYVDYGFLGVGKDSGYALHGLTIGADEPDLTMHTPNTSHSILNTHSAPYVRVKNATPVEYEVLDKYERTVKSANPLGLGVKMKLSFGKVVKAPAVPPAPPVLPKPDTVVRTIILRDTVNNTVVVRDTVQNTVVVRDTVENTVIVRDTITIIKEVPVEIQQTMRDLSNTLFEFNKFNVGPKAQGYLDEIVDWLVANPKVNVEIGGHTDGIGSQEYNQKLSEQRAKTVYNYLVEHGVNKNRLSYKGYGKLEPIADNSTESGRQQNRRVELKIIQ